MYLLFKKFMKAVDWNMEHGTNEHESMRAKTIRIALLKYLHHSLLNWIMIDLDIQAMIGSP
jgi:hypothetical protein